MLVYAESNVGKVRKSNQDSFLVLPEYSLIAVADGMGGHLAGDVASRHAVKILAEFVQRREGSPEEILYEAFNEANNRIYQEALRDSSLNGMGTTLTAAMLQNNRLIVAHVGDSRAYLLQEGEFRQLTHDHSFVNELVRNGNITSQEALNHPHKNYLIRALGMSENVDVDIIVLEVEIGSKILLSSDGLTNMLSLEEIMGIVEGETPRQAVKKLVALALDKGGTDNITAVIGVLEGES